MKNKEKNKGKNLEKSKKGMVMATLVYWIIAVVVLVLAVLGIMILQKKGMSAIEFIKSIFRFKQ